MKKFELNLDRLHNVYFNGGGRGSGKTTLWCYELLGIVETRLYTYDKIKKPVIITYNVPHKWIFSAIDQLESVCEFEKIPFLRKSTDCFVVGEVAFVLVAAQPTTFEYEYSWKGSDLDPSSENLLNREFRERVFADAVDEVSLVNFTTNLN
jgi:hypothetical protein